MFLDEYSMPMQADGDKNDQAQRVGMIAAGVVLGGNTEPVRDVAINLDLLECRPGVYTRFVGATPEDVSADQLIGVLGGRLALGQTRAVFRMLGQMLLRFGFAQNKRRLDGTRNIPDPMIFRAAPLFMRASWLLYPLALLCDLYLLLLATSPALPVWRDNSFFPVRRREDDVDDNNNVLTLALCKRIKPTPISLLSCWLYAKLRPINLGVTIKGAENNIQGALEWYHRAENFGNPEVAALWKPVVKNIFYPR